MARQRNTIRLLRVGVVLNGRIISERLVRRFGDITVGTSPRCTFVVEDGPDRVVVFRRGRHRSSVVFRADERGKLAAGGAVLDLRALCSQGIARRRKGAFEAPLSPGARGKLEVGGVTLLFQMVDAPPPQRLQLPGGMRRRWRDRIDPAFAPFLFGSLVVQVGLVLSLATVEPLANIRTVPDLMNDRFIPAELMLMPTTPNEAKSEVEVAQAAVPTKTPPLDVEPVDERRRDRATPKPDEKPSPEGLRAEAEEKVRKGTIITVIGSEGADGQTLVDRMLDHAHDVRIADAFVDNKIRVASNVAPRDWRPVPTGPGLVTPMPVSAAVGGVPVATGPKRETRVPGFVKALPPEEPIGLGTADPRAIARVVRRRLGRIRTCYERALLKQPGLEGRLLMELAIGEAGRAQVRTVSDGVGGAYVAKCVRGHLERMRFPRPKGGTVTVRYPFVFSRRG